MTLDTSWLGQPTRMLDAKIAEAAGTYNFKLVGLGDDAKVTSVRLRPEYDRAEVRIGNLLYQEDLPRFTTDMGVAAGLLGGESWCLYHHNGIYMVTYRGKDFANKTAAMALCAAFCHFNGGKDVFAPPAPSAEFGKLEMDWLRYFAQRSAKVDDNPAMFEYLRKRGMVCGDTTSRPVLTSYGYDVLDSGHV